MSTIRNRLNWPFAAVWTIGAMALWLTVAIAPSQVEIIEGLVLTASFAQFATVGWRLRQIANRPTAQPLPNLPPSPRPYPPLNPQLDPQLDPQLHPQPNPPPQSPQDSGADIDQDLTWALCWLSHLYLQGSLWLATSLDTALALSLGTWLVEGLLLKFAPAGWQVWLPKAWRSEACSTPAPPWATDADDLGSVQIASRPTQAAPTASHLSQPESLQSAVTGPPQESRQGDEQRNHDNDEQWNHDQMHDEDEAPKNLSVTYYGQSDAGVTVLHGWQRYEMAAGQKNLQLTVGFFPPFPVPPDCELEHEGDHEVSCELEHLTPAGARVILKRRMATEPASGKLYWHCQ